MVAAGDDAQRAARSVSVQPRAVLADAVAGLRPSQPVASQPARQPDELLHKKERKRFFPFPTPRLAAHSTPGGFGCDFMRLKFVTGSRRGAKCKGRPTCGVREFRGRSRRSLV